MRAVASICLSAFPRYSTFLLVAALVFASPHLASAQNTNNPNTSRNANTDTSNSSNSNGNLNNNIGGNRNSNASSNPSGGATKMPECPPAGAPEARVTNVYKDTNPQPSGSPTQAPYIRDVELGDIIVVEGANFKTLLDQAACERKNVVLYLDGRPLKNVTAYPPTDPSQNILKFTLKRTEDSRDVWTYLLGKPSWDGRPVWVSIGIEDKYAVLALNDNKDNSTVHLNVIPHGWFIFWVILFVLLVFGFFALALKSNLLRDSVSSPGGGARRPFSLARTQAAWWFFLVLASYLFIGIITGDFSTTITGTVLGLLGISAGTAVSSAMVDANNSTPEASATQAAATAAVNARLNQLDTDIATAQAAVTANPNDAAAAQNLAALTKEKEERSSQLKKLNNQSENFFIDILSDANGVNFHRFQMAAWTLVLGIIFGFQVWQVLAMPEFNGSLLAVLGISAGTFVGLKTQEPTTPGT